MFLKVILSAAFLALSINAAVIPAADESKSFKFLVDDPTLGKWYLADATGKGTQDASKALTCVLSGDVIKCGGKGFPEFRGDMVQLATTGNSKGWSIDANDNIQWSARPDIKFSIGIQGQTNVWAETCPHHWTTHGTAKAEWVA